MADVIQAIPSAWTGEDQPRPGNFSRHLKFSFDVHVTGNLKSVVDVEPDPRNRGQDRRTAIDHQRRVFRAARPRRLEADDRRLRPGGEDYVSERDSKASRADVPPLRRLTR